MPRTVIIGAGIIGVSTAYYLSHSASGKDHVVTIFDPCPPASGASGKAAGFLSRSWTGEETSSLEELSFQLYKELAERYQGAERWGYRLCNVLAVVAGKATSGSEDVGRGKTRPKRLRSTVYSGELSWLKPAVMESQSLLGDAGSFAQCDPYRFTRFLFEEARSNGVQFLQANVSSLSIVDGRVSAVDVIRVDDGTSLSVSCDNVVIAAGPWTGPLSKSLLPKPIPITSYAGHSVILTPSVPPSADCLFAVVHTEHASHQAQVIPRSSGDIYISGVNDTLDLPPTPEAAMPRATEIAKLKEIADTLLPGYSIKREQLCFRPMTKNGVPFICRYPEVKGVYVGAGHSHFGVILGPGTGKILSEMILGKELSADIGQLPLLD